MNYPIVTSYGRRQSTPMSLPQMKKNHGYMAFSYTVAGCVICAVCFICGCDLPQMCCLFLFFPPPNTMEVVSVQYLRPK